MKKKVLLIAAMFTAGATFAQDALTSKKGVPILPEAGDYAISFDADNLINYAGNLLNNSTANSLNNLNLQNPMTISGKYFVSSDKAYRGMVRLGFNSNTDKDFRGNGSEDDELSTTTINIGIGGAIEMRRGKGRLQGYYGPMAMINLSSQNQEWEYDGNNPAVAGDLIENKSGTTIGVTVGGLAGAEYFFAPKISVGAEIGWGINFQTQGDGEITVADGAGGETTTDTFNDNSFGLDTQPNGNISLNFHF